MRDVPASVGSAVFISLSAVEPLFILGFLTDKNKYAVKPVKIAKIVSVKESLH